MNDTDDISPRPVSVVEIVVALIVTLMISQGLSLGSGFSGFWAIVPVGIVSLLLSVVAFRQSQKFVGTALLAIVAAIAVTNASTASKMFPLQRAVVPTEFRDATVAEVLFHVAKSNETYPGWRFHVSTEELANTRVSIDIEPNTTLEQTLASLMVQTSAHYDWNWHKSCGNSSTPVCASFYIHVGESHDRGEYAVLVELSRSVPCPLLSTWY